MLPKLAACPKYTPKPGPAGPAAERGIRGDDAFRLGLQGDRTKIDALPAEERPGIEWAVALMEDYKRTGTIETREEYLAMHTPGIAHIGTADALCTKLGWVADLKTGQLRGYAEQLAAYCYAMMHMTFEQEYTAHVLYCDHQVVKSYRFTLEQAKQIVERIIAEVNDPAAEPRASEYCGWCANYDFCPAVTKPVEEGLAVIAAESPTLSSMLERVMESPEKLGQFVAQWKAVEKAIAEPALDALKSMLEEGREVDGWKLTEVKGREYFDVEGILWVARETNAPVESIILALGGKMSGKAYREWAAQLGREPLNAHVRTGSTTKQLRQVKTKQTKQLN
jgi:hypothetical protein